MGYKFIRKAPKYNERELSPSYFNEDDFKCEESLENEFRRRVASGLTKTRNSNLLICGTARDCAKSLTWNSYSLEKIGGYFKNYRIFIYENDSVDGTDKELQRWVQRCDKVEFTSEKLGVLRIQGESQERMAIMAFIRNQYLDFIFSHIKDFDYVLVVDMDFRGGWSYTGFLNCFGWDNWDCMLCNGLDNGIYYDMLPLRVDDIEDRVYHYDDGKLYCHEERRLKLKRGEPPFKIWSGFGGAGIYPIDMFKNKVWYEDYDCDHTTICAKWHALGRHNFYINPSFIGLR